VGLLSTVLFIFIYNPMLIKRFLILGLLFLIFRASFCQENLTAFGKADLNELRMKECAFEKDAGAMKLLDYQETELTFTGYDLKISIDRRVRIKIFNKSGFDAANIIIPYIRRSRKSKITDISAYIYTLDTAGNIVTQKLEKNQIFREKSDDGISKVAFAFPNVSAGCVIEYRYTHNEKNSLHLEPWFLQDEIPTTVSTCRFIYPDEMKFDFRVISPDSIAQNHQLRRGVMMRSFHHTNIPSFRPEPLMSSVKDNLQRIEFAFIPRVGFFDFIINEQDRWKFYNLSLLMSPFFGRHFRAPISRTEAILDSVKKISTAAEKVHFIFQQVKDSLKWDETHSFYADNLEEVWLNKSANSAEINLSVLNLLRKAGINAYPILVSTRNNGRTDPDFITLGQFNSVDVLVADSAGFYVLDGTQKYISYKTPPYNILNRDVFLVDTAKSKWVTITDNRSLMRTSITIKAELGTSGELKGDAYISYYDYSKAIKLEEQNEKEKEKEEEDKEFIEKESAEIVIDSLVQENAEDELQPLVHKFGFSYKLSNTDDYYFLDPFFLSNFRRNPFNDTLRRTDIDLGSNQSYSLFLHLTIPDDYSIDELPQSLLIRANDSSMLFKRQIIRQDNELVFRHSFDIQRSVFDKEEYPGIREFFRKIYAVVSDQIVLKKKK